MGYRKILIDKINMRVSENKLVNKKVLRPEAIDILLHRMRRINLDNFFKLNKWVLIITTSLLILDYMNYKNNVWDQYISQYYVFLVHLLSIPILITNLILLWYHDYKNGRDKIGYYGILTSLNLLSFYTVAFGYYYLEVLDYKSSGIFMLCMFCIAVMVRLTRMQHFFATFIFAFIYFGTPIFMGVGYIDAPALYLNGIAVVFLYLFLVQALNKQTENYVRIQILNEQANADLAILNTTLSDQHEIIEEQNERLVGNNQILTNFAEIAAHDIRNLLMVINGYSSLLMKNNKDKFSKEDSMLMDRLLRGCQRMNEMIDGLLQMSSLTRDLPDPQTVHLADLIDRVVLDLNLSVEVTKTQIINTNVAAKIEGHEGLLYDLFINIISNSIKFSRPNEPNIVTLTQEYESEKELKLIFEDRGIGLKGVDTAPLFNLFVKNHWGTKKSGNGLGLTVCKRIIDFYGGQIFLNANEYDGATVSIIWPINTSLLSTVVTQEKPIADYPVHPNRRI